MALCQYFVQLFQPDVQLNTDVVVAVHTREEDVSDDERQHVLGYVLLPLLRLWRILLMI